MKPPKDFQLKKSALRQFFSELRDPVAQAFFNKHFGKKNKILSRQEDSEEYADFDKTTKDGRHITYLKLLESYSAETPYFLYFVITKEGMTEKVGYEKYIPNVAVETLDVRSFSGLIQILDMNGIVRAENTAINESVSAKQRCKNTTHVVIHNCSHGGNHAPGELCGEGNSNDGFYETVTTVVCYEDYSGPVVEEITHPGFGGGGGGGSTPPPTTPCQELKKLTGNTNIKNTFDGPDGLQGKVGDNKEFGFAFSKKPGYLATTPIIRNPQNPAELNMMAYIGGEYIGASHTHPHPSTGFYPMFSPLDLVYLGRVAMKHDTNGQDRNFSEYVLTLTVPQGTFAIKIKDAVKFMFALGNKFKGDKGIEAVLEGKYDRRKSTDNIDNMKKDLLEIFKEFDVGLGLYEASPGFSGWSEVELNTSGQVEKKPCN